MSDSRDIASALRMVIAQHPDGLRVLRDLDAALAVLTGHPTDVTHLSDGARQIVQNLVDAGVHRAPHHRKDNDA
ncbi:hypothetical protein LRS13_13490 [Svornostia abyssi]|uniref:Uncharacterized protein n=1 Tax=Svornostia abyssi TaxID=2898438 RepID=A0ABY5PAU7_9ACTN|nr:hypothetical protein LRS13_13490 [Parviterribacteraceae bacterium J379]